jgi:hypothetical protein
MLKMSAKISAGPHVNCLLFFSDLNQNWNVLKNFNNTPHIKLNENLFDSEVFSCIWME